jgi:hypothetical protein
MAIQPIPIKLQAATVPNGVTAANLQELLVLITRYTAASITEDIGFFRFGNSLPLTNVGPFYNLGDNKFYTWSTSLGRYVNDTGTAAPLDVVYSYRDEDDHLNGWVVADGRQISALTHLTTRQRAVLESKWGAGGNLPNLRQGNLVPVSGSVPAGNGTYTLVLNTPWAGELINVSFKTNAGTVTAEVKNDGSTVAGLNAIPCSVTKSTTAPAGTTNVAQDKEISVTLTSSGGGASVLYYTVVLRPTVADSLVARIYVGTP